MEATEPAPTKPNSSPGTLRLTKEETKLILRIRESREGLFFVVVGSGTIVSMARLAPELVKLS